MSVDAAPDPFLIALAALELLSEAASHAPLVLIVEDSHWLDAATADALAFVARRLDADRVTLVAAFRDGGAPDVDSAQMSQGLADAGWPELFLDALDDDAAAALLDRAAPALDRRRRARILAAAHGNPLALVELPHAPADEVLPLSPG